MSKSALITGPDDRMTIKKKGVFDLHKLYADIYKWFQEKKYEFHERDHKYKAAVSTGEQHEITIHAWRDEDDFNRWEYRIIITMWDYLPVMVPVNGIMTELAQARIKFDIKPFFVFDYRDKYEHTKFGRMLRDFMINKMFEKKIKTEGDKFEYEFHELQELIKQDLDIFAAGNQFAHFWK